MSWKQPTFGDTALNSMDLQNQKLLVPLPAVDNVAALVHSCGWDQIRLGAAPRKCGYITSYFGGSLELSPNWKQHSCVHLAPGSVVLSLTNNMLPNPDWWPIFQTWDKSNISGCPWGHWDIVSTFKLSQKIPRLLGTFFVICINQSYWLESSNSHLWCWIRISTALLL